MECGGKHVTQVLTNNNILIVYELVYSQVN